jgi:hypothetical protein
MLFKERIAIYSENLMEHINTFVGESVNFLDVNADGMYCNHFALRGWKKDRQRTSKSYTWFYEGHFKGTAQ